MCYFIIVHRSSVTLNAEYLVLACYFNDRNFSFKFDKDLSCIFFHLNYLLTFLGVGRLIFCWD